VKALASNPAFLLADEMGTGKTVITCVALSILYHKGAIRRTLILCPKSVLAVWDRHLLDWASELSVTVVNGSRDIRDIDWKCPAHVYVATYDTFRNDHERGKIDTFDAVVLDEAHAIRNAKSGRARASRQMTQHASFRWALTGTPIQNSVDDLCSIFGCLKPDLFRQDEDLDAETVRNRIRPYFLRRRKQDVFNDLPEKILTDEWLEMDEVQAKAYSELLEAGKDEFRTGRKEFTKMHVFALLRKLTQICNFAPGKSSSPKTEALGDQVEQIVANWKKVLVYSQYIDEGIAKLEPILRQHGLVKITGSTSQEKRKAAVDRFQSDADVRVFLGSVKAAGEGITLTAASYVIHFDHWWNPAVMWQAEDRAHRKGQTETVNVYSYWMRDTIEERIKQKLEQKSLLHKDIIDRLSEEEFDEALTIDDLLDIFELDRGAVKMPTPSVHAKPTTDSGKLVDVLQRLSEMNPMDFEVLSREVLKKAFRYANARVTKRSHDGGIDIVGSKTTRTGIERIIAQCKRKPLVGPEVGRELLGVLTSNSSLSKAYLIVSGSVTDACRQFCLASGRIDIIDGPHLARIIIDQGIAVKGVD
jgi:SNF2 family DNA or RNA helicase